MISVAPMPQEVAIAHAGRIALINACRSQIQAQRMIAAQAERLAEGAGKFPLLCQLALVSGMAGSDYVRQHSMLPVLRVVVHSKSVTPYGSDSDMSLTRLVGARLQTKNAQLCPDCVREDLSHWRFSWFRRTHNLAGIDVCPVHGIGLSRVTASNPWTKLPHHWVDSGKTKAVMDDGLTSAESTFQHRLHEIYDYLLEKSCPFDIATMRIALARRLKELGLRTSRTAGEPLLSDYARACIPIGWVSRHIPQLNVKREGAFWPALDRLPTPSITPGTGFSYAMTLATVFERAEDASLYLADAKTQVSALPKARARGKAKNKYPPEFWRGQFWSICVSKLGNASAIAEQLGVERNFVVDWMKRVGFPSFKGINSAGRWKALSRFVGGESLLTACREEGVDVSELEEMLRYASAPLSEMATEVSMRRAVGLLRPSKAPSSSSRVAIL